MNIQAIPTKYKHTTFRSRLEARWAVFFDELEIKWNYEKEGFLLDGLPYLPDFDLPTFQGGCYVEVKPIEFTEEENEKANRLVIASQRPLWKAIDIPSFTDYEVIFPEGDKTYTLRGIPNLGAATNRMWIDASATDLMNLNDKYVRALENSNHYNFNHG